MIHVGDSCLVSWMLLLYIAFMSKYLLSLNSWILRFGLRLMSWVCCNTSFFSCKNYANRIICLVLQQRSHFFHHSRSATTKYTFWWESTSSILGELFILHRTLTDPRRMFSAWKNLRHRALSEGFQYTV